MDEIDDFSGCLVLNTVVAARALLRRYDKRLSPFGVTVAQFSLLMMVRKYPGSTLTAMSMHIAMDRTTLTRNLDLLARKKLVQKKRAGKGNALICTLTSEGDALLDRLIPQWRKAQEEMKDLFGGDEADGFLEALKRLTRG
ncbi:MAG: MarR family winged helix-turn-helix transcriptional regulator [Hyphomicrobiales bacterium]|nr:MarR family winged helix-turn-helix transcriptional regulator [Hyphomicrobiales bacterium]